ncbi:MAG: TetR/AcrR family transcriptional regulator [Microthrixaceae bacterium]
MSETRGRIVSATTELFRSQGFNHTSLKQVTAQAGAPTGSIYHFFPGGKNELGAAVVRESGAAYQALFEVMADEADDIVDAVGGFFDGAAEVLEQTDFIDICPIGNVAREVANTHEPIRLATVEVFAGWTAALADRLARAGLNADDAGGLADTVISALEGGFMLARARRSCDGLRATGAHMRRLVEAALAGDLE